MRNANQDPYLHDKNRWKKTWDKKTGEQKELINEALFIIDSFGVPLEGITPRILEGMALAFLAVTDIKCTGDWANAKDLNNRSMTTRDIISYCNENFNEERSSGSYDGVRKKDLRDLTLSNIVVNSMPNSDPNDSTRGYSLNPVYADLVRNYGSYDWEEKVSSFISSTTTYRARVEQKRNIKKVMITLPDGTALDFSYGTHNELQKAIIEDFLPLFGFGAQLLYVGDTVDRNSFKEDTILKELGFFEIERGALPDIIAYSYEKNWLFVIEAVYSCNPVTIYRKLKIEELAAQCTADIIFVSAFPDKKTFKKFSSEIAWETEVWIANIPDHMIHFNGDKFFGPYKNEK